MKTPRLATRLSRKRSPTLRFNPLAWAKLTYLRDRGATEIGGFGLTDPDDLLCVQDIVLVHQVCSPISVVFEDDAVADFFDRQVDQGRQPEQFGRIWLHTHPGHSAEPSLTDEETFERVFGTCDWAVMFILARGGQAFARLRLNVGLGAEVELPTDLDFGSPFAGTDFAAWEAEYATQVETEVLARLDPRDEPTSRQAIQGDPFDDAAGAQSWW